MMKTTNSTESLPELGAPGEHHPLVPKPTKSRKRGLVWLVFLVVIVGVASYAVWRAGQPAGGGRNGQAKGKGGGKGGGKGRFAGLGAVPVVVQKVGRSNVPVYLNGLGNVTAFYTVTVKSRVDGQLMKVLFNEGDLVKEGQTLIEIDPRPYQVQLEMAQATLARDTATLNNANLDLERYKGAIASDAIPKQQLDTQQALVNQLQATLKQDQANVDSANLNITYAHITAPITGVVGLRQVDPGNIVHAADANGMIVITQLQPISVLFTIPEDSLPQVTQKLRGGAHLPVDAFNRDMSKKLASGMLITLDNQINNTTGTAQLKAVFDNTDNALFPQQFVNIRLLVDTLSNQMTVPNVAIQNGQQGTFVYVVDDDSKVHLKTVKVGTTTDTVSDILGGLSDSDRVVIDGTDRLIEGATVRIRQPGEYEAPAGSAAAAAATNNKAAAGKGKSGFKKSGSKKDTSKNGGNSGDNAGGAQQ
jgi:multidrug efflux system membrane fusion protein